MIRQSTGRTTGPALPKLFILNNIDLKPAQNPGGPGRIYCDAALELLEACRICGRFASIVNDHGGPLVDIALKVNVVVVCAVFVFVGAILLGAF